MLLAITIRLPVLLFRTMCLPRTCIFRAYVLALMSSRMPQAYYTRSGAHAILGLIGPFAYTPGFW